MRRLFARASAVPALAVLAVLILVPLASFADEARRHGDDGANVLLTLTVVDTETSGRGSSRSLRALALDGRQVRIQTGWRQPIPVTTAHAVAANSAQPPAVTYQYQDLGISTALMARVLPDGRVRAEGRVEVSAVGEIGDTTPRPGAPRVESFEHQFDVVLEDGVEAALVEVPKPDGGSMILRLSAAVQG